MSKRVTIILDEELMKKIRIKQVQLIKKSVSFSRVLNDILRSTL